MTSKWSMVGEMFGGAIDIDIMEQIVNNYKTWEIERYFCEYLMTDEHMVSQWRIDTLNKLLKNIGD